MKKLKVLVLSQQASMPPEQTEGVDAKDREIWKTSHDVISTLEKLGHEVHTLGITDELAPIRNALTDGKPDIVFNLVEAFTGSVIFDQHVVSYLELMRMPYTGCNPRGLTIARDKAISKKLLAYHRIKVPDFAPYPIGRKVRRPRRLEFPLIVKSLSEDGSVGISQASIVHSDDKLVERVRFVHESIGTDAMAEQFIPGRELYVPVIGNQRLQVLPTWELIMENIQDESMFIATEKAKFDLDYQERHGITHGAAHNISEELGRRITRVSKRIYRNLGLSGYARLDFRLDSEDNLYFLEANPNPEIAEEEEVSSSAQAAGIPYDTLIQKILNLGMQRTRVTH